MVQKLFFTLLGSALFASLLALPALSLAQQTTTQAATETLASLEIAMNPEGRKSLITVTRSDKITALMIYRANGNVSAPTQFLLRDTQLLNVFADAADISLQADPAGGFCLSIENTVYQSGNCFVMDKNHGIILNHAKWIDKNSGLVSTMSWQQQRISYQLAEQPSLTVEQALAAQPLKGLQKLPFAEEACIHDVPERCMQVRTAQLEQVLNQSEQRLKTTMQQVYGGKSDSYGVAYLKAFESYRQQAFSSWQQFRDANCYQQFYIDGMNEREISNLAEQCRFSLTLDRLAKTQSAIKTLKK